MDTSRSAFLTPSMIKEFLAVHQMEFIDKDYAIKIIQVRLFCYYYIQKK